MQQRSTAKWLGAFAIVSMAAATRAAELTSISPTCVSTAGGTEVAIAGTGFRSTHEITIGGRGVRNPQVVDATLIRAITPALPQGTHDVVLLARGGLVEDTLRDAVQAVPTPVIIHVMPYLVAIEGGDRVDYVGEFFCESYAPMLLGMGIAGPVQVPLTDAVFVDAARIRATVPSLPSNPQTYDAVLLNGEQGVANLRGGVRSRRRADLPEITSVVPAVTLPSGGEPAPILITGRNVSLSNMVPVVAGRFIEVISYPNDSTWFGSVHSLPVGVYDVWLAEEANLSKVPEVLWGGYTVMEAVTDLTVVPSTVPIQGGLSVEVRARNLHATTTIAFGGRNLLKPEPILDDATGALIGFRGMAPAHSEGPKDVTAIDERGTVTVPSAVRYVRPVIEAVEPSVVLAHEETTVTFIGEHFTDNLIPYLGRLRLSAVRFLGPTRIEGVTPELEAGHYDAILYHSGIVLVGVAELEGAVEAREPVILESVDPSVVSTEGTTAVEVRGQNFQSDVVVRIGGNELLEAVLVSGDLIRGVAPPHAPGAVDVTAEDAVSSDVLPGGVVYEEPAPVPVITAVDPSVVATTGGTRIAFIGTDFTASLIPALGDQPLTGVTFVNSTRIEGTTPVVEEGFHDAVLYRQDGPAVVEVARRARALQALLPVELHGVEPSSVSTEGTTAVEVYGENFRDDVVIRLGGKALLGVVRESSAYIRGVAPSHSAGPKDVTAEDSISSAVLENGVVYVEPVPEPVITSVEPSQVSSFGGTPVSFNGDNFSADLEPRIGSHRLATSRRVSDEQIVGETQSIEAGVYDAHLVDRGSGAVVATLRRALEVLEPEEVIPGPREFDTSLAFDMSLNERTARFRWVNPAEYSWIEVEDLQGNLISSLPGDATYLELEVGEMERVDLRFTGFVAADQISVPSLSFAKVYNCSRPPPLMGNGLKGPVEFTLYGGPRFMIDVGLDRWPGLGDGGGAAIDDPVSIFDIPAHNGVPQREGSIGYMRSEFLLGDIPPPVHYRSKITTGFILEQPADKLEVAAYYRKIDTAPDLELRGRLTLVHAYDPGQLSEAEATLSQEFVFPDVMISDPPACEDSGGDGGGASIEMPLERAVYDPEIRWWNDTVVFRHSARTNAPCPEGDVCPFPAGEYLFDIFVVGGDPKLPYYKFVDDMRMHELIIPGVPCPPYPLAKVTDLTGLRTLPVIDKVTAEVRMVRPRGNGGVRVRPEITFVAHGVWTDEDGTTYSVEADDPGEFVDPLHPASSPTYPAYKQHPSVRYGWRIKGVSPSVFKETQGNRLEHYVPFGSYTIELTVTDIGCGISKKRTFPLTVHPPVDCPEQYRWDFLFPSPDPGGTYAVIGLKGLPPSGPGGIGSFQGKHPLQVRVLVVPRCTVEGACPESCPGAILDRCDSYSNPIEFRLAYRTLDDPGQTRKELLPPPSSQNPLSHIWRLFDPLRNQEIGPKYFTVHIDDLTAIPKVAETNEWMEVYLQAKGRLEGSGDWRDVSSNKMFFINSPLVLSESFWTGYFDPSDLSYHFAAKSAEQTETGFPASSTRPFDLMGLVEVESKQNDVGTGFTAHFGMAAGIWHPEDGTGTSSGEVMSNMLDTAPVIMQGEQVGEGQGGGASLEDLMNENYEWCHDEIIFANTFEQALFNSIIYSGVIGPVPVTVWAAASLGLNYCVEAYAYVNVRPFTLLDGRNNFVETHFTLLSRVNIYFPCEVRADIIGGVVNVSGGLVPEATFEFDTHVETKGAQLTPEAFIQCLLSLYMRVRGCVDIPFVPEVCATFKWPLFEHLELIPPNPELPAGCPRLYTCGYPDGLAGDSSTCWAEKTCGGGAGGGGSEGAGAYDPVSPIFKVISTPAHATHPDGTIIGTFVTDEEEGKGVIYIDDVAGGVLNDSEGILSFYDADACFTADPPVPGESSARIALVSWTSTYSTYGIELPEDLEELNDDLGLRNQISRNSDIVVTPVIKVQADPIDRPHLYEWQVGDHINISEVPDYSSPDRTADGRSSIAGSIYHGDAIAAWVRYETPEILIVDTEHPKLVRKKVADLEPGEQCAGPSSNGWCWVEVENIRPALEETMIYTRRLDHSGSIDPDIRPVSSRGINIEPTIAFSPSGETAWCVWVHDPTHIDLIQSNIGRNLFYAVWHRSTDTWEPALPVFAGDIHPDDYPGLLQPSISLSGEDSGSLVFTALQAGADENDTGLAIGGRFVYLSRLEGGVFGAPELIHGRCQVRQFGEWPSSTFLDVWAIDDRPAKVRQPEEVMQWWRTGLPMSSESPGGWMVAVRGRGMSQPTEPVSLLPDGVIYSNMAFSAGGGAIHATFLNGGSAVIDPLQGRGANTWLESARFEQTSVALEPDLAIIGCEVSHQFAAPGATVEVKVFLENKGLAGSAIHRDTEETMVGVRLVLIDEGAGIALEVARSQVPELQPGEDFAIELTAAMPHDPVKLRVELAPNPIDRDRSNDWWECFFGAPPPRDVLCEEVVLPGNRGGVQLTWSNAALYDENLIYRNGEMLASLPGRKTMFVDQYVDEVESAEVVYAVRGRLGASTSQRVECSYGPPPPPLVSFLRGDSTGEGAIDLTDAVFIFSYLFLGGEKPICLRAADANGSEALDISDGVYLLGYLFLGGPEPPPPFPRCGEEPADEGLECETQPGCR